MRPVCEQADAPVVTRTLTDLIREPPNRLVRRIEPRARRLSGVGAYLIERRVQPPQRRRVVSPQAATKHSVEDSGKKLHRRDPHVKRQRTAPFEVNRNDRQRIVRIVFGDDA